MSSQTMYYKDIARQALGLLTGGRFYLPLINKLRRQGVRVPRFFRKLPVNGVIQVELPGGSSFQYHSTSCDSLGRRLFWGGFEAYETETVAPFFRLAQKSRMVLDIGAYTGLFSLLAAAANPQGRVISWEPVPQVRTRLEANIRLNGWEDRCQVRPEAVSDAVGAAKMFVPGGSLPVMASLHAPGAWSRRKGYQIQVPVTTVDACIPSGQKVDLAKIDVEGFEDKVLTGMERVLAESAPDLFVEIIPEGPHRAVAEILKRFGYRFYHLRPEGPTLTPEIIPDPQRTHLNYLCTVRSELF